MTRAEKDALAEAIRGTLCCRESKDEVVKKSAIITALMDLRDEFIAKQPRSEWVNNKVAQGVEKGIELCIEKVRVMADDG